jgi:hypothetical protein
MANEEVQETVTETAAVEVAQSAEIDYEAIIKEVLGGTTEAQGESQAAEEVAPSEKLPEVKEEPVVQVSPQLALLAKKEKSLREREAAVETRVKEEVERQVKEALESLRLEASQNPKEYLKKLGFERPVDVAADIYYDELGDDAPAEFKAKKQQIQANKQLAEMKRLVAEFEHKQAEAQSVKERDVYISQLNGYLQASLEGQPYLAAEYEDDPLGTLDAMMQAAANMIGSSGKVPSAKDVAEALNAEISKLATRYSQMGEKAQKETRPPSGKPATTTLTTKQTAGKANIQDPAFDKERTISELIAEVKASMVQG